MVSQPLTGMARSLVAEPVTPFARTSRFGCGLNVLDHWNWAAHSPVQDLGTLTGYLHTNAVLINGVVSPNKIPTGTVIPF
jgi:hypothetical protein